MPDRLRAATTAVLTVFMGWALLAPTPAAAADPLKVVIIVGPTGALTDSYRETGNKIADAAEAAGAVVVKVYSPRATWSRVRNAVDGANVVVYLGHGNGYPSPYSSTEWTDRVNGWGLNRTTEGGDSDDWSTKMVYCGEKALLGTLTSSDGAAQWKFCGGAKGTDGIYPAANWVMIYNKACYTPGASEGWDTKATEPVAFERVRNFSYPALKADGGAYFATDIYQGGQQLVSLVLSHRDWTFGAIAEAANGYQLSAQRRKAHPDLDGREIWIQRTTTSMGTDYWFAYAGNPSLTPSGAMGDYVPPPAPLVTAVTPLDDAAGVSATTKLTATFDQPVAGVSASSFTVRDVYGLTVDGTVSYSSSTRKATFTPVAPLEAGLTYRATLSGSIRSLVGVRLDSTSWKFSVLGPVAASTTVYSEPQDLVLEPGTNTRYRFTGSGALRGESTATLAVMTVASTTLSRALPNQSGRWFYVSAGTWAGYWLRASGAVHLADGGATASAGEDQAFDPAAQVRVSRGTHTGYTFADDGTMLAYTTATLGGSHAEAASDLRTLAGQTGQWFHMTSGPWKGCWLRASDVVRLD